MASKLSVVLSVAFVVSLMLASAIPFAVASSFFYRTYGGRGEAYCVVQTSDGGYAMVGFTAYNQSDADAWLVKTDSDGNMEWDKTYDAGSMGSIVQASDGGYTIAGSTSSFGAGRSDFWLVKTDSSGNMEWNQTYGGPKDDHACSIVQTRDGGYTIAGDTNSYGVGYTDFWLVKTDSSGNMEWNQTYGGPYSDSAHSMVQTSDGGYAIAGDTNSYRIGYTDFLLVKTDSLGNVEWNQTYGIAGSNWPQSVVQTSDGGYALAGYKGSFTADYYDCWLVKTDSAGNMEWNQPYSLSTVGDMCHSMIQTKDGGYLLAGVKGFTTMFLIKTDSLGNMDWNQTHGYGNANSVIETSDGGYAMAGNAWGNPESPSFCLVKTDEAGIIPEFPSWTPILTFVVLAVVLAVYRKGISSRNIPE